MNQGEATAPLSRWPGNKWTAMIDGSTEVRIQLSPESARRPWLIPKLGETVQQWNCRTNHSCYACGDFYEDLTELDAHEATHR